MLYIKRNNYIPYGKIYSLLEYKLKRQGIELIKQKEHYSSQVSPFAPEVNKANASKNKRKERGLYENGQYNNVGFSYNYSLDCIRVIFLKY